MKCVIMIGRLPPSWRGMDATQAVNDSFFESDEEEKEEKPNKARQPLAKLCILKNDHVPEREFPLFMGDNVLGRDVSICTLPLLAPSVSKQHAAIHISLHQRRGSRSGVEIEAVVRDLGSMNGTRIGRVKLIPNIPYPLSEGNCLFMADMPCQYLGIDDAHQNIGGRPLGVGISLARDSVEKRDGLKVSAAQMSQAWAKVSPLGKAEKKPAKNSCVSFEATPVQLQRTLVPESESDSDGERPRNGESRRKLQGSDSSPTCSTFLSPTNKIVPESPDCADGTPITPSSSTRETSHGHVSFSKEESDVDAGGQQKKDTLAFVDDSDEEQAGAAENGPTPRTAHFVLEQLKTPASFTEEELPQLSTSTESPHAISKFNMDSDTDVEEDAGEPKAVPDQRSDVDCFYMDSDTDADDDDDTGAPSAPPAQPEEGEGHPDMKAEGKKGDAAPPLMPDDFQLDSDTDVDEEADDNSGDTAPSGLALIGNVSEPEDDQAVPARNTQANVSDSAAGSHNSNAVQDPPRSSPVATAPSSATPGIAGAAAQSESDKDTDVDESSVPPAERDSDTDAEEEDNAKTLPRTEGLQFPHVQNCSTPVQLPEGDVEQMATQAFLPPSLDPFEHVFNGAGRAATLNGQEEEEDFAVAETQSFILQPQGQIRSCDDGANRASGCESSGEDTDELASGGVSFQLGLSDSSHLQSAAQALALESTQAFDSDPQAYTKPPNADTTASLGNGFNIEATQAYEACEAPDSSPAMPAVSPKINLAFQETQAYISEPCSESEDEPKEETESQPPFDLPTSSSLALAETKLVVACQEEERPTPDNPVAPLKRKQIAKKRNLSKEHAEAQSPFVAPTIGESQLRCAREAEDASAEQPQLEEATQLFTDVDIMERQPTAASQTEDSHGEDPMGVLSETKVQLDEVAQPIASSSALAVNCQLMSIAATQPMATSEIEESDDEDPIPVWAQGKVQFDQEMKADMSSSALPANHQPWGLAATQPMAATVIEESDDEDSSPVLAEGNVQLDQEMKSKGSSSGLPANNQPCRITSSKSEETVSKNSTQVSHESKMQSNNEEQPSTSSHVLAVATQPVATNEESGDEDLIAVLHERKVQLDKDRQRHTNSCSLAAHHMFMSIAPTQPMTPSENEETDVEDSIEVLHVSEVRLNEKTQASTSSCAVTTPPVSIAATQPAATSEESDEDEDSLPVLRGKRKARPLQITEETQSLSSTLEIPSDSWNEKSPSKNGAEGPVSSKEPPSVTPIQPEEEETQTNFDTLPNNDEDEPGPGQEEKAKVSSAGTPPMDTCEEEEADSEIFIPGSRKRKAKPLQIEDETQSLVSSQGEDERCEIPNSAPSAVDCQPKSAKEPGPRAQQGQSDVGTSVTVKHSKGTRSQSREKEEPGEERQTRSKMGKPGPAGSALEEEATRRQRDPLRVRGGKQERRQGPNARRGKKEGEETEQSEAAEDRQRHERLETETKEQPRRDKADKAPQHNQEGKPEATPRGRRGTRRTAAALPIAAADQDNVPAKRTRLRSNSVSSEVSTSSTQGSRGRGPETSDGSAAKQPPEQDSHGTPALGALSRSSSSNSLASDMSCGSLDSRRGRGGRQRGSGRKTEPGPSSIPPISSQSPAPTLRLRGQRGKKADVSPTALCDENDEGKPGSKQAPVTRGRRRATVKEPSDACEGNNSAGESPLPQRNIRGRAQRTVKGEVFEALVTPPGSNEVETKDVVEGRKRVMKAEVQDENPAPVQAKRRAKASCAQGGRNARDSPPDVATEHGNATSVRGSGQGAQVDRQADIRAIDASVKNAFKWSWLEEKDLNGDFLSDYIRKVDKPGLAICIWCNASLRYGSSGKKDLKSHSKKAKHNAVRKSMGRNQSLPAVFSATKATNEGTTTKPLSSLPYGAAPDVLDSSSCSELVQPPRPYISIQDRKAHFEAMTRAFISEHSLPLSLIPRLINFAQEFGRDPEASQGMKMERTTASYKLKDGLAEVVHQRLVKDLQSHKFSMNIGECTSTNNQNILSILVSYYRDAQNECVVQHYLSTTLTVVNAAAIHSIILENFEKDSIPLENLISNLSDSASDTRGEKGGVETLLRSSAPHLLDIDGDTCHHIQNAVRKFCSSFKSLVEKLCDDLFTDAKYSADIKEYLQELCAILGVRYLAPTQRVSHRWLSTYDVTERNLSIIEPLTLLYASWIPNDLQPSYAIHTDHLLEKLSEQSAKRVQAIQMECAAKGLTDDGRKRKLRLVDKLFYQRDKTILTMNMYVSVLLMFKSFVLTFERKEPMVHRLHHEQTDLFRHFLASFMQQEKLRDISASQLQTIDVSDASVHLPAKDIFIGDAAEKILKGLSRHNGLRQQFRKRVREAYVAAAQYLQEKLPLSNQLLKCMSAIDPKAQGHSVTHSHLKKLVKYFPTVMSSSSDTDLYLREISRIQVDSNLPDCAIVVDGESKVKRLDHWWAEVMPSYPALGKVVKACLSIFSGPRIEQSFRVMNDIIDPKSNRLAIRTYSAIQTVKYDLKARNTTALGDFHRDDIHRDPVDKSLVCHMQTAYGRYKRRLQAEKEMGELKN